MFFLTYLTWPSLLTVPCTVILWKTSIAAITEFILEQHFAPIFNCLRHKYTAIIKVITSITYDTFFLPFCDLIWFILRFFLSSNYITSNPLSRINLDISFLQILHNIFLRKQWITYQSCPLVNIVDQILQFKFSWMFCFNGVHSLLHLSLSCPGNFESNIQIDAG